MYLRYKPEYKRICKICGKEGFVKDLKSFFQCPVCNWIEDEEQEKNHKLRKGRNAKSYNRVKKEYEKNYKKYGILKDKVIKVIMKNAEIHEGVCRDFRYDELLMPNNGSWIKIRDIKLIKIIEETVNFKCSILEGLEDDKIAEKSCFAVQFAVNHPGKNIKTEEWIKGYNSNYARICEKCIRHFPICK